MFHDIVPLRTIRNDMIKSVYFQDVDLWYPILRHCSVSSASFGRLRAKTMTAVSPMCSCNGWESSTAVLIWKNILLMMLVCRCSCSRIPCLRSYVYEVLTNESRFRRPRVQRSRHDGCGGRQLWQQTIWSPTALSWALVIVSSKSKVAVVYAIVPNVTQ